MATRTLIVLLLLILVGSIAVRIDAVEKAPLTEYQNRRARLAEQIRGNVLVLKAAEDEELVKYYQEKNFFYLTGFDEPDATLVLDSSKTPPLEILFIPARNPSQEQWTGVKLVRDPTLNALPASPRCCRTAIS